MIKKFRKRYSAFRYRGYLKKRERASWAPYDLSIYRQLVLQIARLPDLEFMPFLENQKHSEKIQIFVRHDIDTHRCIGNLSPLLNIDRSATVCAGVYFRVDDEEYLLRGYREVIRFYRDSGFEVGLHTCCYTKDNVFEEFKRETEKFAEEAGFWPTSFSVHGLGDYRQAARIKFYREIANRLEEFGYKFGDIPPLRSYDYVVQDCHFDENRNFFIYDDFVHLPLFFPKGTTFLILTHPCYWRV